jgi:hypothetical protein
MVRGDPVVLLRPQRLGTAFCPVGATTIGGFAVCHLRASANIVLRRGALQEGGFQAKDCSRLSRRGIPYPESPSLTLP